MIIIKNKRCKIENILKEYPDAQIFDVTSKGEYKTLSPSILTVEYQFHFLEQLHHNL